MVPLHSIPVLRPTWRYTECLWNLPTSNSLYFYMKFSSFFRSPDHYLNSHLVISLLFYLWIHHRGGAYSIMALLSRKTWSGLEAFIWHFLHSQSCSILVQLVFIISRIVMQSTEIFILARIMRQLTDSTLVTHPMKLRNFNFLPGIMASLLHNLAKGCYWKIPKSYQIYGPCHTMPLVTLVWKRQSGYY